MSPRGNTRRDDGPKVDARDEHGLARGPWYGLTVYVCRIVYVTLFDGRIFRASRMRERGAVLLASNHQSIFDPIAVGLAHDRQSCYLAKDSLFRIPLLARLIRGYHAYPVPRESVSPRGALDVCIRILKAGRSLVFFPEGTRSTDGRMHPLRRGVALVAKRSRAPVLPIFIRGSYDCWPRGRAFPRFGSVQLWVGNVTEFHENESADSFIDRLTERYRTLAAEVSAAGPNGRASERGGDDPRGGSGDSGLGEAPPDPRETVERSVLPKPVGDDSLVADTTARCSALELSARGIS